MTDAPFAVHLHLDAGDIIGESLVWDERTDRLLWVDIAGRRIHRLDPASGAHDIWPTPDFVAAIGLCTDGRAIVSLRKSVALWDYGSEFRHLADIEPDLPDNRINDCAVAPDGSFWVGTMQNTVDEDGKAMPLTRSSGMLHRVDAGGNVTRLSDDMFCATNTLVWTRRGFVTSDTGLNETYLYDMAQDGRSIRNRRPLHAPLDRGIPDGSCLDDEGYIWQARTGGGGCVVRLSPDGEVDRYVETPCQSATSCVFGGPRRDTLYITSTQYGLGDEHLANHPEEGALFAANPGFTGPPAFRFEI
nr:SMP-30/gluconolactonase/LRE family protein [Sphingomonas sp. Y57]